MEIAILYFLLCCIVAGLARKKRRSGLGYLLLSLIFSPIISLMILLVAGEKIS